jgi:hypothetical protein
MPQSQGEDDYPFEAEIGEASHPAEKQQSPHDSQKRTDGRPIDRADLYVYTCWVTKAPDFTVLDQSGEPWSLADQRGHAVVLLFLRGDW